MIIFRFPKISTLSKYYEWVDWLNPLFRAKRVDFWYDKEEIEGFTFNEEADYIVFKLRFGL